MDESSGNTVADRRYRYIHDTQKGPQETIDVHHIIIQRSKIKGFILRLSSLLLFGSPPSYFSYRFWSISMFVHDENIQMQGKLITVLLWCLLLLAFIVKLLLRKLVVKESVIIMPSFGVQLETQCGSGVTICRFVPMSKILKAVLNECVTPVTCYWSLALIIHGEQELMLVFKELHPPVKMLVPVWKALCAAIDVGECTTFQEFN